MHARVSVCLLACLPACLLGCMYVCMHGWLAGWMEDSCSGCLIPSRQIRLLTLPGPSLFTHFKQEKMDPRMFRSRTLCSFFGAPCTIFRSEAVALQRARLWRPSLGVLGLVLNLELHNPVTSVNHERWSLSSQVRYRCQCEARGQRCAPFCSCVVPLLVLIHYLGLGFMS